MPAQGKALGEIVKKYSKAQRVEPNRIGPPRSGLV